MDEGENERVSGGEEEEEEEVVKVGAFCAKSSLTVISLKNRARRVRVRKRKRAIHQRSAGLQSLVTLAMSRIQSVNQQKRVMFPNWMLHLRGLKKSALRR